MKLKTREELIISWIINDHITLAEIPKEYRTKKVCLVALNHNINCWWAIPEKLRADKDISWKLALYRAREKYKSKQDLKLSLLDRIKNKLRSVRV